MKEKLELLKQNYTDYFTLNGYKNNEPVMITSGMDKSVYFIGSAISVLKPKLLNKDIDNTGDFIIQRAIRTRGIQNLDVPEISEWCSYFDASGILVKYDCMDKLVYDIFDFLNKKLNIETKDLMIRISSSDTDLINSLKNIDSNIKREFDTKPEVYYKHKYGLQDFGIFGRNFNIAIKDPNSEEYKDIGNIIVIESDKEKYGVECAIGLNSIIMRREGLKSSIEASNIVDVYSLNKPEDYKFADCLSVVSHLAYEDVSRLADRSPNYLYRKYLKFLMYWGNKLGMDQNDIKKLLKEYILLEYNKYSEETINKNYDKILLKTKGWFENERK